MITSKEFLLKYWKQYIQLEKEFSVTANYVAVDSINYNTYSDAYLKIILQVGSEIDICCKLLCDLLGERIKNNGGINKYRDYITAHIKDFPNIRIDEKLSGIRLYPWKEWKIENRVPIWWTVYNKIKHHRVSIGDISGVKQEYYKFANLKYALYSLAGLYQLMIYSYYYIAKREKSELFIPLPGSRLFETESSFWKGLNKGTDVVFVRDESKGTARLYMPDFDY